MANTAINEILHVNYNIFFFTPWYRTYRELSSKYDVVLNYSKFPVAIMDRVPNTFLAACLK